MKNELTTEIEYNQGQIWCFIRKERKILDTLCWNLSVTPEVMKEQIDTRMVMISKGLALVEALNK